MGLLIITRSKFFEEALKFILNNVTDDIDAVSSPEELIELLKSKEYEAVICDLSCADGEFEEKARRIKKIAPKVKVIAFSFDPPDRHRNFITSAGADGYVNRPLNPDSVLESIESIVRNS